MKLRDFDGTLSSFYSFYWFSPVFSPSQVTTQTRFEKLRPSSLDLNSISHGTHQRPARYIDMLLLVRGQGILISNNSTPYTALIDIKTDKNQSTIDYQPRRESLICKHRLYGSLA